MKYKHLAIALGTIFTSLLILLFSCKKINDSTSLGGGLIPPVDNISTFDTTLEVHAFNDTFNILTDTTLSTTSMMGIIMMLGIVVCLNVESIRQFLSWLTNTELFSPELYFLSKLPADMDTGETTAVVVMALALSLLATLYPSWRAARLDPVEALRYE